MSCLTVLELYYAISVSLLLGRDSESGLILDVDCTVVSKFCVDSNGALKDATASKMQSVIALPWNSLVREKNRVRRIFTIG